MSESVKFGVLIRAWGPEDEPGEAQYHEYIEDADSEDDAKERAIHTAKNHFTKGIIDTHGGYEVLEVERYE